VCVEARHAVATRARRRRRRPDLTLVGGVGVPGCRRAPSPPTAMPAVKPTRTSDSAACKAHWAEFHARTGTCASGCP
jgi:hypothetical protein